MDKIEPSFTEITLPTLQLPDQTQGYYNAPISDSQIKFGSNPDFTSVKYYALDFLWTSGAVGDGTYRDIIYTGLNGDMAKTYTQTILNGLGTSTVQITKKYNIETPISDTIRIPAGRVCEAQARFFSSTQLLRLFASTGSTKLLFGSDTTLTQGNPYVTFLNISQDDIDLKIRFATTASDRPTFGLFLKIF